RLPCCHNSLQHLSAMEQRALGCKQPIIRDMKSKAWSHIELKRPAMTGLNRPAFPKRLSGNEQPAEEALVQ
ncbi:hypothetical protein, partial [Comamonas aquatica]|uniref:hypothetical protein n=1 Tax=Comamonas aquatica TaxID=225991 RepID=UPI0028D67757